MAISMDFNDSKMALKGAHLNKTGAVVEMIRARGAASEAGANADEPESRAYNNRHYVSGRNLNSPVCQLQRSLPVSTAPLT